MEMLVEVWGAIFQPVVSFLPYKINQSQINLCDGAFIPFSLFYSNLKGLILPTNIQRSRHICCLMKLTHLVYHVRYFAIYYWMCLFLMRYYNITVFPNTESQYTRHSKRVLCWKYVLMAVFGNNFNLTLIFSYFFLQIIDYITIFFILLGIENIFNESKKFTK